MATTATARPEATPAAPAAAGAAPAASANASLYCGDLPHDITEAVLFDLFKAVGPVLSIRVCRDAVTRRSLGYAYVNFQNPTDAERALETLNYHQIGDRPIRIMWCHRDPGLRKAGAGNVFIKNLHEDIDNQTLYDTFSQFGNILSCKVACDASTKSLGHGFVHFESDSAAAAAIEKVNGMLLKEKKVFVGLFMRRQARLAETQGEFSNTYVKGLKSELSKEDLTKFFESKYGELKSVALNTDRRGRQFAFIDFKDHEAAAKAVEEWHDVECADLCDAEAKLYIQRAQKKSERGDELKKRFAQAKAKRISEYTGHNLFVKNLDDNVTETDLRGEFSKFGEITSARVMMDDKDPPTSKGFGFVCFKDIDAANQALQTMNGQMLGAKPLYVNVAQRREVRRATLEIQYAARLGRGGPGGANMQPGVQGFNPMFQHQHYFAGAPNMHQHMAAYQHMHQAGRGMMGRGPMPGYPGNPAAMGGMRPQQQQRRGPPGAYPPQMKGRGPMPGAPMPGMAPAMQANYKYTAQARNRDANAASAVPSGAAAAPQMPIPGGQEPLTTAALANMSPEQQKNTLGERLFARINESNPEYAAKITGMLLEMDISEQLHLLEAPDMLGGKISEALEVLKGHQA